MFGTEELQLYKLVIFGPPGVGKSSLFQVLLGNDPNFIRSSTGVLHRKLVQVKVAITTTADKSQSSWNLIGIEEEVSRLRSTIKKVIAEQNSSEMQEEYNISSDTDVSPLKVDKMICQRTSNVFDYASTIMACYDSGGQPEFFDVMPALTTLPSGNIMVFNMSKDLHSKIDSKLYKKGSTSQLQHQAHYTTAELMQTAIANIQSYSKNIIPDVNNATFESNARNLLVVGTFLDELSGQTIDEKLQKIDEIERKMCSDILPEGAMQMVHYSCNGRIIHPISNFVSEGRDKAAQQIRTAVEDMSKYNKSYSQVPINWLLFQLEVQLTDKDYITRDKCVKIAKDCFINEDKVNSVLMYFHQLGILLYYKKVTGLKNVIFSRPQWVFNQLTELIELKYNPSSIIDINQGILNKQRLHDFYSSKLDKEGVLKPENLLELFIHLKIMSELPNKPDHYFMPALLNPAPTDILLEKEYGKKAYDTMLVKFSGMCFPRGMFCGLVTHLAQIDWEIQFKHAYKNLIVFKSKPNHYVALFDEIDNMAVKMYCKEDNHFETNHYEVCNRIFKGLEKLCKQFQMKSDYEFGFDCKECKKFASVKLQYPFPRNCSCSKCESCPLTNDQLVWLFPSDIFKPQVGIYVSIVFLCTCKYIFIWLIYVNAYLYIICSFSCHLCITYIIVVN